MVHAISAPSPDSLLDGSAESTEPCGREIFLEDRVIRLHLSVWEKRQSSPWVLVSWAGLPSPFKVKPAP
jgi:hypothetical protein